MRAEALPAKRGRRLLDAGSAMSATDTGVILFQAGEVVEEKILRKVLGEMFRWAVVGDFVKYNGRLWLNRRWTPSWKVLKDIVKPAHAR